MYIHCSKLTSLQDELSRLDEDVQVLIISCMGGIINTMSSAPDPKHTLEKTMRMLGGLMIDAIRKHSGRLRVFVAPSTPRTAANFESHCKHSVVRDFNIALLHHIN